MWRVRAKPVRPSTSLRAAGRSTWQSSSGDGAPSVAVGFLGGEVADEFLGLTKQGRRRLAVPEIQQALADLGKLIGAGRRILVVADVEEGGGQVLTGQGGVARGDRVGRVGVTRRAPVGRGHRFDDGQGLIGSIRAEDPGDVALEVIVEPGVVESLHG